MLEKKGNNILERIIKQYKIPDYKTYLRIASNFRIKENKIPSRDFAKIISETFVQVLDEVKKILLLSSNNYC